MASERAVRAAAGPGRAAAPRDPWLALRDVEDHRVTDGDGSAAEGVAHLDVHVDGVARRRREVGAVVRQAPIVVALRPVPIQDQTCRMCRTDC
jgi:hypothetical protein